MSLQRVKDEEAFFFSFSSVLSDVYNACSLFSSRDKSLLFRFFYSFQLQRFEKKPTITTENKFSFFHFVWLPSKCKRNTMWLKYNQVRGTMPLNKTEMIRVVSTFSIMEKLYSNVLVFLLLCNCKPISFTSLFIVCDAKGSFVRT